MKNFTVCVREIKWNFDFIYWPLDHALSTCEDPDSHFYVILLGHTVSSGFILRGINKGWYQYFGSTISHYFSFFSQILFVVDTFNVKHLKFILLSDNVGYLSLKLAVLWKFGSVSSFTGWLTVSKLSKVNIWQKKSQMG